MVKSDENSAFASELGSRRATIEQALDQRFVQSAADPGRLIEAVRYALLGPGKRLRACITTWTAEAVGGQLEPALLPAVAVELLHAYTLVHDDLPAMDDDDFRRGRPTVHKVFGEATAILVGDALLTHAFATLAEMDEPEQAIACVRILAQAGGIDGVIRGQVRDLATLHSDAGGESTPIDLAELEQIHAEKTGALFAAAAQMGAVAGGGSPLEVSIMKDYGMFLGILFQHADDLDDQDRPELAARARVRLAELSERAISRLRRLPESNARYQLEALVLATTRPHVL